jgi:hypothetical protein
MRRIVRPAGVITKHPFTDRKGYLYFPRPKKYLHIENYKETYGEIPDGWGVHHINQIKTDNRPENLIAVPSFLHGKIHRVMATMRWDPSRDELVEYVIEHLILAWMTGNKNFGGSGIREFLDWEDRRALLRDSGRRMPKYVRAEDLVLFDLYQHDCGE